MANTIIFKHIQNHDDSVSIGADGTVAGHGYNVMKYSIVLVNTDGTVTETLPQGSVVPDEYTFYNTTVDMSTAFTQMGLSIPGYTIKNGWAFFWWSGSYQGKMFKVPYVRNFGVKNTHYQNYWSYLGFQGLEGNVTGNGGPAGYDDYMNATFGSTSAGDGGYAADSSYYAYNPTGTLRIVLFEVTDTTKFKSHFVDAFDPAGTGVNQVEVDTTEMNMTRDGWNSQTQKWNWYGTLSSVTSKMPTREGYAFAGWYTERDAHGNGTGSKVQTNSDDPTHYGQDAYYYAKWVPTTVKLTITKSVSAGDKGKEFHFTVTKTSGEGGDLAVADGGNATANADKTVSADLHDGESATITVPYGASVAIAETNRDGYTTSFAVGGGQATASDDGSYALSGLTADTTVTVTNTIKPAELTIRKVITGKQADMTKKFNFTVQRGGVTIYSAQLGNGGSKTIGGSGELEGVELQWGDAVTISEADNAGYDTTYTVNGGDSQSYGEGGAQITLNADSTTVVFTNAKKDVTVTGVKSAGVPGAVAVVGVAAFAIAGGFALVRRTLR